MGSSASKFSTGERGDVAGGLLPMEGNRNSKGWGESCLDKLGRFSEGLKELRFIDLRSAKRNYVFRACCSKCADLQQKASGYVHNFMISSRLHVMRGKLRLSPERRAPTGASLHLLLSYSP